ncbi:MAG: acyltransferase family protein, partial [Acidimicrobiia bacterium]
RRARRLVPAALLFVGVAAAYLLFGSSRPPAGVFGDGVATLTWVANWRFVFEGRSYGDLFSEPTPFQHVWSLAVEEQFYLGLPLVALALLGLRGEAKRRRFGAGVVAVIAASTAAAWALHEPGAAPVRAYYGTDARVAELAVGVLLALLLVPETGLRRLASRHVRMLTAAASVGAGVLVALFATADPADTFLYRGGFLFTAVASAVVVAAATQRGPVATALRWKPLVAAGRVTYGAYLFHWPIFLWLTEGSTGLAPVPLLLVRAAITFGLAALSFRLLEQPVRRGDFGWRIGGLSWANGSIAALAILFAVTTTAVSPPASSLMAAGPADMQRPPPPPLPPPSPGTDAESVPTTAPPVTAPPATVAPRKPSGPAAAPRPPRPRPTIPTGRAAGPSSPPPTQPPAPAAPSPSEASAPVRVAVVGDSLANNLARGLAAWAEGRNDIVVYNLSSPGCPLSRGGTRRMDSDGDFYVPNDCDWWSDPEEWRHEYLRDFDPDVIIAHDALNEIPDRSRREWDHEYLHLGNPTLDRWLLSEYGQILDYLNDGAKVMLLDAPCIDPEVLQQWRYMSDYAARADLLNEMYASLDAADTTLHGLDEQLCPGGRFTPDVFGVEGARSDGYHLDDAGARALAENWLGPLAVGVGRG